MAVCDCPEERKRERENERKKHEVLNSRLKVQTWCNSKKPFSMWPQDRQGSSDAKCNCAGYQTGTKVRLFTSASSVVKMRTPLGEMFVNRRVLETFGLTLRSKSPNPVQGEISLSLHLQETWDSTQPLLKTYPDAHHQLQNRRREALWEENPRSVGGRGIKIHYVPWNWKVLSVYIEGHVQVIFQSVRPRRMKYKIGVSNIYSHMLGIIMWYMICQSNKRALENVMVLTNIHAYAKIPLQVRACAG